MRYPYSGIIVRFQDVTPAIPTPESSVATSESPSATPTNSVSSGASDASSKINDELHVNYWEVGSRRFLDIGVMISSLTVQAIRVDVPWKLKRSQIFDLGSELNGEKIITAVFNEVVHYESASDGDYAHIRLDPQGARDRKFTILRLNGTHLNASTEEMLSGGFSTRIQITVPSVPDNVIQGARYVRVRIVEVPRNVYTSMFYQKDRNVLSSSPETRIFDFRVNVRRGVPDDVLAGEADYIFPKFSKIHMFAIVPRERELAFQSERFKGCRSLEDEAVWNGYIQLPQRSKFSFDSVRNYLGYQWSVSAKEGGVKDLVALARFTSVKSSVPNIVRFLMLALVVGASGSGIWAYAWCLRRPDTSGCSAAEVSDIHSLLVYRAAPAAFLLVIASPKNLVRLYEAAKEGAKWALRRIGYYLSNQ